MKFSPLSIDTGHAVDDNNRSNNIFVDTDGTTTTTNANTTTSSPTTIASTTITAKMILEEKILDLIEQQPNQTIRPGKLATKLGLSVEEASQLLCELLAAVGTGNTTTTTTTTTTGSDVGTDSDHSEVVVVTGATFRLVPAHSEYSNRQSQSLLQHQQQQQQSGSNDPIVLTMEFTFPMNVRQIIKKRRRTDTRIQSLQTVGTLMVRFLKIMTAFGLLLSLCIVSIAMIFAIIGLIIALSRVSNDRNQHNTVLIQQIYHICSIFRQLLWCYAVFGNPLEDEYDEEDGSTRGNGTNTDPFLREIAYDVWLFCSVLCGSPGSLYFWLRANQFNQRHRRYRQQQQRNNNNNNNNNASNNNMNPLYRSWKSNTNTTMHESNEIIPGVTVICNHNNNHQHHHHHHQQDNNNSKHNNNNHHDPNEHRGFLSIAVEFLFGPTPFLFSKPTKEEKWKLRAATIIQKASSSSTTTTDRATSSTQLVSKGAIPLCVLVPYIDSPPNHTSDVTTTTTNTALILHQVLLIVSYFNGVPIQIKPPPPQQQKQNAHETIESIQPFTTPNDERNEANDLMKPLNMENKNRMNNNNNNDNNNNILTSSYIIFPELMAESTYLNTYQTATTPCITSDGMEEMKEKEETVMTWSSLLFAGTSTTTTTTTTTTSSIHNKNNNTKQSMVDGTDVVPSYLQEQLYHFTTLTRGQFIHVGFLGFLNVIGVVWFGQVISDHGILNVGTTPILKVLIRQVLYPTLHFYSILFFMIPFLRLLLILVLNQYRTERNRRRQQYSVLYKQS